MPLFIQNDLVLLFLKIYGALFILGPIVLRATFRFKAKLDPQLVPPETLPPDVRQFMMPALSAIAGLGVDEVGYINLGTMAGGTQSYMALLSNSTTLEWADVSVVKSAKQMKGYSEFITRCSDDAQVDTNTNATAPVLFPLALLSRLPLSSGQGRVHALPRASDFSATKHGGGSRPELPAKGQELTELKRGVWNDLECASRSAGTCIWIPRAIISV